MSDADELIEAMAFDRDPPAARLLDGVHRFVTRYVVLGEHESVAIALWVLHAWVLDAFEATGYLEIRSPVRRCGKTTLLDVLALLVPRPWSAIEPSEAVFYRRISSDRPTLLLDETDAIFAKKSEATEGLRSCLNAGNRRGTRVPRCVPPKMDIVEFEVFCAKALAGIGGLPATITDRSVPVEMRRKQSGDRVERFRSRKAAQLAEPLAAELAAWAADAVAAVELELIRVEHLADEGQPLASLDDRSFEQAWEPLVAVASLAGEPWRQRALAAAVALSGSRDDEQDVGVTLLADVRAVFGDYTDRESLSTHELLDALLELDESPWRDWWSDPRADEVKPSKAAPRKLARTLRPFAIRPGTVKLPSGGTAKGYRLHAFRDAWTRYVVQHDTAEDASPPSPPSHPGSHAGCGVTDSEPASVTTDAYPAHPSPDAAISSRSDAGDAGDGYAAPDEWLARDGVWHTFADEPPVFPAEVLDTRQGTS